MTHTFTEYSPIEYLKIDIASNYGDYNGQDLEKLDFETRIGWFDDMERSGKLGGLIETADNPALFFSALTAYSEVLDGKPIGYAISLDACSSGLQILATLANCEKSALRCGVVSTGHREDAYTTLHQDMVAAASFPVEATRKEMKNVVMTSLYGSKVEPRNLFGAGTEALLLYYKTLEEGIPGAWSLNLALKDLWQPFATHHEWVVPDGFEVSMAVEESTMTQVQFMGEPVEIWTKDLRGIRKGLSLSPNIVHSLDGMIVREITRRCMFDKRHVENLRDIADIALKRRARRASTMGHGRKKDQGLARLVKRYQDTGFFSARILDLVDEKNISLLPVTRLVALIDTLPVDPFPVLSIHDCFRVHPNYGNDLRRQYNRILSELAASEVLSDIASQVTGRRLQLQKVGDISAKILNANYTLS